jgi:hypothetical protein
MGRDSSSSCWEKDMRRILVCSMVFTAFVVLPFAVTAQNGNNKGKTTQATDKDYAVLARLSQVVCKIVSTDASKITVSIENDVRSGTTGNGRSRRPNVQKDQIEFELPLKDKAVIRKMYISTVFDEKGNPKTSASADDKGKKPASAPGGGYVCDVTDLIAGTVVRLQLGAPKKSATAAKKDDDAAAADLSTHSIVQSVTALSEPKDQMASDNGNKKKKNQ